MSSSRAPISSASEKARREFGDVRADGLHAEHDMIVGARDDADEALVGLFGHRPAVGAEREEADDDLAIAGPAASGESPTATISGSVKQIAGNGDGDRRRASRPR